MSSVDDDKSVKIHTELSRALGLPSALAIGVGTMVAAGIFTLSGLAAGEVGSAAIASFLLAALVALFSALAYCEFSAVYPESGEGYLYARKTFNPPLAYFVGLALLLGYTASCAFFISSLSSYFQTFVWQAPVQALSGVLALLGLIVLNIKGTRQSGTFQILITAAKVLVLLWFIFGGLSVIEPALVVERFSADVIPIGSTAGLVFITFLGFSTIAASAGEVANPEKTIPRAIFISMAIVTVLFTAVVLVLISANPTEYTETSMGNAATQLLGNIGGWVIVGGAIFSMISAANASIMACSRMMLAMSSRGHLPKVVGSIDSRTRTPVVAVVLVGAASLVLATALPLEELAHFATTVLLLALTMVNAALIFHRRKFPDMKRPFRVPLVPLLPILGIAANVYLLAQIVHHFVPVLMALLALLAGMVGFFAWKGFQSIEMEIPGPPSLLALERSDQAQVDFRVLVPIANPATVRPLLQLAAYIARERGGEILVLRVVQIPDQLPLQMNIDELEREREILEATHLMVSEMGVPMTSMVKIGRNVARAILETTRERDCDLVVLGWKGHTSTARRILGEITDLVVRHAAVDLMLVKMSKNPSFQRLLLPTAGGDHARRAEGYAASMIKETGGSLTVLSIEGTMVADGRAHDNLRQAGERLTALGLGAEVEKALVKHDSVPQAIIEQARSYDALVIGATRDSYSRQVLFGSIPEKVAKEAEHSVIVVKAHDPLRAFVGRVVGE